jgi:hypothetical protein
LGGGGEQNAETWTFDTATNKWALQEPNTSPPGACCNQQNVFDAAGGRFVRFPAFSGSHGWQWYREVYLNNSSMWNYDLASNTCTLTDTHCASDDECEDQQDDNAREWAVEDQ